MSSAVKTSSLTEKRWLFSTCVFEKACHFLRLALYDVGEWKRVVWEIQLQSERSLVNETETYNPTLPYRNRTTPEVIIQLLPVFKMIQCMLPNLSSLPPQPPPVMNKYYIARATWAYGTLEFVVGFQIKNCWIFPDRSNDLQVSRFN